MSYQKKRSLSVFEKNKKRKGKKSIISISNGGNSGGNFKNTLKSFCRRHQKHATHTFSIYGNCVITRPNCALDRRTILCLYVHKQL